MDPQARQRSTALEAVTAALANWTVSRHEEVDPDLPERYGSVWRDIWVNDVAVRIGYLVQATAVRRPEIFVQATTWGRHAFAARSVPESDLRTSLACLREVVAAELPAEIADEAVAIIAAGEKCFETALAPAPSTIDRHRTTDDDLVLRYLEAVLDGRLAEAEGLIMDAAEGGRSVPDLYLNVLQPAQVELGRLWHLHEVSVADEHVATAVTIAVMGRLRGHLKRGPDNGRRVVTCSVGGDLHEIPVRMISDFFEADGWTVIRLGVNLPHEDVVASLARHRADLVALSASTTLHLRAAGELIAAIRTDREGTATKIMVGGGPFNELDGLWKDLGADAHAPSAAEAIASANALFTKTG